MEYIATFHTHSGALKFEKCMKKLGHNVTLGPVPRVLSSSCGICARFDVDAYKTCSNEDLEDVYEKEHMNFNKIWSNE